jgi:hypothetical protein
MTLKEKFDNVEIMFENQIGSLKYDELSEASNQCEKIADDFAIGFADWIRVCKRKGRPYDFDNIKELLEIYKEEKEL